MKKLLLATVLLAASATLYAQDKNETIEGNGKIEIKTYQVKSFDALRVSGIYELRLTQGGTESVKVEADENLLQYFNVANEGNALVIDMEKLDKKNVNFKSKSKMIVHVTFKKVNSMETKTIGDVVSTGNLSFDNVEISSKGVGNVKLDVTASKFNLRSKGVGNIVLSGKAESAEITNSGVGSLEAGNFVVQSMDIHNTGMGSAEVNAVKDLKMKASGWGKVTNKGAAPVPKTKKISNI